MQLDCLVCPEAGIGGFVVADRMEGHSLVAGVDEVDDMGSLWSYGTACRRLPRI